MAGSGLCVDGSGRQAGGQAGGRTDGLWSVGIRWAVLGRTGGDTYCHQLSTINRREHFSQQEQRRGKKMCSFSFYFFIFLFFYFFYTGRTVRDGQGRSARH